MFFKCLKFSLLNLLMVSTAFSVASTAKADFISDESFRVKTESLSLPYDLFSTDLKSETIYDRASGVLNISNDALGAFTKIAAAQTDIWGDTILEGDYEVASAMQVDQIKKLTISDSVIAYRIVYSQQAWDTSTCSYTGNPKELGLCSEGRIDEASFVSPDLASWIRDPEAFAQFKDK